MAEEKTDTTAAAEPAKKGGIMGMLPMIGGIVGGVVVGTTVGFLLLGPRMAPASSAPSAKAEEAKHDEKKGEHGEGKGGETAPIYMIDNLIVNSAGSGGSQYLLLTVALEVKDEAAIAMLKARDAELRDAVLRMFGSKTSAQVAEASLRDGLRDELVATLSKLLPAGTIHKVYFPQFVIQ